MAASIAARNSLSCRPWAALEAADYRPPGCTWRPCRSAVWEAGRLTRGAGWSGLDAPQPPQSAGQVAAARQAGADEHAVGQALDRRQVLASSVAGFRDEDALVPSVPRTSQ